MLEQKLLFCNKSIDVTGEDVILNKIFDMKISYENKEKDLSGIGRIFEGSINTPEGEIYFRVNKRLLSELPTL
jgi:hypothetical protein